MVLPEQNKFQIEYKVNDMINLRHIMKHIFSFILMVASLLAIGCSSEDVILDMETTSGTTGFTSVGNPVEVTLNITALPFDEDVLTRVETPVDYDFKGEVEIAAYECEQRMMTFWIFEYDYETHKLIHEPYYERKSAEGKKEITNFTLSDNLGKPVIIYAVVNAKQSVSVSDWVKLNEQTGEYDGFMTMEELEAQDLPTTYQYATQPYKAELFTDDNGNLDFTMVYQDWPPYYYNISNNSNAKSTVYIPKCGYIGGDGDLKITNGGSINIPVTNMYAKVMVYVKDEHFAPGETQYNFNILVENIPCYSRIAPLGDAETYDVSNVIYPDTTRWTYTSIAGNTGYETTYYPYDEDDTKYIVYVPENFQGENGESSVRDENVPQSRMTSKKYDDPTNTSSSYKLTSVADNTDALAVHYYSWTAKQCFGPLYPGGNTTTNFNIRRNCTYLVTFNLDAPDPDNDVIIKNQGTEGYFDNATTFEY